MTGMMVSGTRLMISVNLRMKDLMDATHWYCFECSDFKPTSGTAMSLLQRLDDDMDYNYEEDVIKRRQMNKDTRKRVRTMCMCPRSAFM